jgi:hypothetical protein
MPWFALPAFGLLKRDAKRKRGPMPQTSACGAPEGARAVFGSRHHMFCVFRRAIPSCEGRDQQTRTLRCVAATERHTLFFVIARLDRAIQ